MAIINFGGGITGARGHVGGTTFSANASGAYMKARSGRVTKRTTATGTQRSQFGQLTSLWRSLTDAQRNSWIALAQTYPHLNSLGNSSPLTGQQLFNALNSNLFLIEVAYNVSAPVLVGAQINQIIGLIVSHAGSFINLTLNVNLDANTSVLIFLTPALAPGFMKPPSFKLGSPYLTPGSTTPVNIAAQFLGLYGTFPALGSKVFVRAESINLHTGERYLMGYTSAICA